MVFAKRLFLVAAVYGLVVLPPQYFMEARIGRDFPPPITHPEYFYGFLGVALAWQLLFLLIAGDPARYRLAMLPAIVEKYSWGIAVLVLYFQDRVTGITLAAGVVDLLLGTLFMEAFRRTARLRT